MGVPLQMMLSAIARGRVAVDVIRYRLQRIVQLMEIPNVVVCKKAKLIFVRKGLKDGWKDPGGLLATSLTSGLLTKTALFSLPWHSQ